MKRLLKWRHLLALAVLVPSLLLVVSLTTSPVLAACSLSSGSTIQYWVDGVYYNSLNVSGTKANLGAFNPDPVFSTYAEGGTSFWVMITKNVSNNADDRVAQIGWLKASDPGFNDPYVFFQIWNDSGGLYTLHPNCDTNYWGYLYYASSCKANSSANYKVEKNLSTNVFTMTWGTFPSFSATYNWDPNQALISGEIHKHGSSTTTTLGDHYPGAVNAVVQAIAPKVRLGSGSYSSVNFSVHNPHTGVADVQTFGSPNTKVQYWDPRCTS